MRRCQTTATARSYSTRPLMSHTLHVVVLLLKRYCFAVSMINVDEQLVSGNNESAEMSRLS